MSCKEEYEKYMKIDNGNIENLYYKKYILPESMKDNQYILKKLEEDDMAKLPKNYCKLIVQNYIHRLGLYNIGGS